MVWAEFKLKEPFYEGTGKSFLLNQIVAQLKQDYGEDFGNSVAICASTGIAATHIGGEYITTLSTCMIPDMFDILWRL